MSAPDHSTQQAEVRLRDETLQHMRVQSLRIDALVAVLVKAVQEQQEQINELRALVGK